MPLVLFLSLILHSYPIQAQPKTQVVLLGVYHHNNLGQDVAKVKVDDVLGGKQQAEIRRMALLAVPGILYNLFMGLTGNNSGWK
jgi:hypothetical protein